MADSTIDLEDVFSMSLDIRESTTLRRRLCDWVVSRREEVSALIPYDYTIYDARKRSSTTQEYLQHLYTLAQMRRDFFMRESPIWHCMEIIIEWTKQKIYQCEGMHAQCRWIFKKHCAGQERRDREQRERKRKRQQVDKMRKIEKKKEQQRQKREDKQRLKEQHKRYTLTMRIKRAARKFENSKRKWSNKDRQDLLDRIIAADDKQKSKMFDIIEFYGCDVNPFEWTTQTCRHVSKVIGRPKTYETSIIDLKSSASEESILYSDDDTYSEQL